MNCSKCTLFSFTQLSGIYFMAIFFWFSCLELLIFNWIFYLDSDKKLKTFISHICLTVFILLLNNSEEIPKIEVKNEKEKSLHKINSNRIIFLKKWNKKSFILTSFYSNFKISYLNTEGHIFFYNERVKLAIKYLIKKVILGFTFHLKKQIQDNICKNIVHYCYVCFFSASWYKNDSKVLQHFGMC